MIECQPEDSLPFAKDGPYVTVRDKALAACNSAMLLDAEGHTDDEEEVEDLQAQVRDQLSNLATGKSTKIADIATTPAGALYVQNVLSKYDAVVVNDALQLRTYITNRLVIESDSMDPRVRLKALELLGKITEVGLFTERSEVTVTQKSTEDLSETLKSKLRKLIGASEAEEAVIIQHPIKLEQKISAIDI
jgi:hypothetical protein